MRELASSPTDLRPQCFFWINPSVSYDSTNGISIASWLLEEKQ